MYRATGAGRRGAARKFISILSEAARGDTTVGRSVLRQSSAAPDVTAFHNVPAGENPDPHRETMKDDNERLEAARKLLEKLRNSYRKLPISQQRAVHDTLICTSRVLATNVARAG